MAIPLRQSTSCTITLGPMVDSTDGNTEETALTTTGSDFRVSKNGGAFAAANDSTDMNHDEKGWYRKTLNATDTGTLGSLVVHWHPTGALPAWREFEVMPSAVWDALYASSGGYIPADLQRYLGNAVPTADTAGYPKVTVKSGTGTGEISLTSGVAAASVASGGITTSSFAAGAINAAAIAADAIGASELAADAATEIATAVWAAGTREITGFTAAARAQAVADHMRLHFGYRGILFVNANDGSDSNDGLSPFAAKLTITAAKTAATTGTLIVVCEGTYDERNLFKNGVDYYFARGAFVYYTGSANGALFDDGSTGTNGLVTTRIYGYGRFCRAGTGTGDTAVFKVSNASSRVYVAGEQIWNSCATGSNNTGVYQTAGVFTAEIIEDITSDYYDGCVLYGAAASSCAISANRIIGTGDDGIEVQAAGPVVVRASLIRGVAGSGVNAGANAGTLNLVVEADRVIGNAQGAFLDGATGDVLVLRCGRINGGFGGGTGDGVTLYAGGTLFIDGGIVTTDTASGSAVKCEAGTLYVNGAVCRGGSSGYDLNRTGGTLSVSHTNYRRSSTNGTITEAPPSDRVTQALPAATAGASGGLFIAGTNAATTITTALTTTFTGNLTGNVGGNVTGSVGSVASGGITSASFGSGAVNAAALATDAANEIADALLDRADAIETGVTLRQAVRGCFAMEGGLVSGAGTGTEVVKAGGGGATTRATWTVDSSGNRTAVTWNL